MRKQVSFSDASSPSSLDRFKGRLRSRTAVLGDKPCAEGHASVPLVIKDVRLGCCAGSGHVCKLRELDYLYKEVETKCQQNDDLRTENARLRQRNEELTRLMNEMAAQRQEETSSLQREADVQKRSRSEGWDKPSPNWVGTFPEIFPQAPVVPPSPLPSPPAQVTHVHNVTNVVNVNVFGTELVREKGAEILMLACQGKAHVFDSAVKYLERRPTSESKKLLSLRKANRRAFEQVIIKDLKNAVPEMAPECQSEALEGLQSLEKAVGNQVSQAQSSSPSPTASGHQL